MGEDLNARMGMDTTDFKTGLATANRELRVLESSFRASAASLGDWAKDASGLELRIKSLTSQIEVQKSKVAALEGEYQRVAAEKGATSKAAQDLEIKLNKENETLGKMTSELGNTEKALSGMGDESGDASKKTNELEKEEKDATGSTSKFADALHNLKGKLSATVSGLGSLVGSVAKVTAGLAVGLAGAAIGAAAGMAALVVKSAATADELVETAEKMGITTTRLQELNYIAEQTGTGVDTMQSSMARMVRSLNDAEKAGSPTAKAFEQLGVSVRDSNGNLRDSEAIFFDAVGALQGVGNETERDQLAMQLFGKSAMELNPLINLGADGLAAMSAEANNLGAVMGEGAVTGLADFNDSLAGVKAGFQGLLGTLATAFLPIINQVMEFIRSTVVPWLQENLPKAIQVLSDYWTTVLQPAIQAVWNWLSTVLIPFFKNVIIPWLQDNIPKALQTLSDFWTDTLKPAIESVWNWMSTVLIPFLQDVVFPWLQENIPKAIQTLSDFWTDILQPAIQAVWNWMSTVLIPFLQDTVFPWLQENIPAAIQTLSDFWTDTLKPAIETVWAWIKDTLIPFFQNTLEPVVGEDIPNAIQTLSDFWNNTLLPAITAVYDFFNTYILPIIQDVIDICSTLGEIALTALAGFWEKTLQPALKTVYDFFNDNILPIMQDVKDFISDTLGPAVTWLADEVFTPLANTLSGAVQSALTWLHDKLLAIAEFLKNFHLPDWLSPGSPTPFEMGLRGINEALREMSTYNLPALSRSLNGFSGSGGFGQNVTNSWSYVIQAANPLQTSSDLVRQVRLLELMH